MASLHPSMHGPLTGKLPHFDVAGVQCYASLQWLDMLHACCSMIDCIVVAARWVVYAAAQCLLMLQSRQYGLLPLCQCTPAKAEACT